MFASKITRSRRAVLVFHPFFMVLFSSFLPVLLHSSLLMLWLAVIEANSETAPQWGTSGHGTSAFEFTYRLVNKTLPKHGPGHCSATAHTHEVLESLLTWFWPMSSSTPRAIPISTFWISMDQRQFLECKSSPHRHKTRQASWYPRMVWLWLSPQCPGHVFLLSCL